MNSMNRITLGTCALGIALMLAPSASAKPATHQAPHACKSHSAKVVAAKCADRNGDGRIERLPDGTTR